MLEYFDDLLSKLRSCSLCTKDLKDGIRPAVQVSPQAKILIAGQAPGSRVHATGIAFDDPGGDRLGLWMCLDRDTFYAAERVAILPMGFCFRIRASRAIYRRCRYAPKPGGIS